MRRTTSLLATAALALLAAFSACSGATSGAKDPPDTSVEFGQDAGPDVAPDVAGDAVSDVGIDQPTLVDATLDQGESGVDLVDEELTDGIADGADGETSSPPLDSVPETDLEADVLEVTPDVPYVPTCEASCVVLSPGAHAMFGPLDTVSLAAQVTSDAPNLMVSWQLSDGTEVAQSVVGEGGLSSTEASLPGGGVVLSAVVRNQDGPCAGEPGSVSLVVCQQEIVDDFSVYSPGIWKTFTDASWQSGGWIEMTGAYQGHRGAMYSASSEVMHGPVRVAFTFATGGGMSTYNGGDGMAMTIVSVPTEAQLEALIEEAQPGGGLGYGVGNEYGDWVVEALTVEIDTWQNVYNPGVGELHSDPTSEAHIALTLNGDPGNHVVWFAVPTIEDWQWHDIVIEIQGTDVRVTLDEVDAIHTTVPEMDFRGGHIFFSGSTGWAYNEHRFDNLHILHHCF